MTQSADSSELNKFGRLAMPSTAELGVYGLLSLALLFIGALTAVRNWLGITGEDFTFTALLPADFNGFLNSLSTSSILPNLATAIFWGGVGGGAYIVLWFAGNVVIDTRNNVVVIQDYIKPISSKDIPRAKSQFVQATALRLAAIAALLGFTMITISVLLPLYIGLFRGAVLNWQDLNFILNGLAGLVGLMVVMHIFVIFLRLILLRVRIFS